jgi:O-antigen ligase
MRQAQAPAAAPRAALWFAALALAIVAGLFGGASRDDAVRLAIVELAALPLAVLALRRVPTGRPFVAGAAILALAFAIPLVQLVPLPPALWEALPGHAPRARALAAAGLAPGWAPISLFPRATAGCVLALLPPAGLFLATAALTGAERRVLAAAWIGVGAAGLALGVAQLVQPAGGWAYPYADTNLGSLVGLFANRNHEAGLLLALIPLCAAVAAGGGGAGRGGAWTRGASAAMGLAALLALGLVRSRAGIILAGPAALGALAVLVRARTPRRRLLVAGAGLLAVVVATGAFALGPIAERFMPQDKVQGRLEHWPAVVAAARPFQPIGAGIGAFERVFRAAEPLDLVGPSYFNHAHDEYLELWLEAGWAALALLMAFLAWFAVLAWRAWSRRGGSLAQGASVAIALLAAQSVVDYPLRTEALACLFAFACGCLAAEASATARTRRAGERG